MPEHAVPTFGSLNAGFWFGIVTFRQKCAAEADTVFDVGNCVVGVWMQYKKVCLTDASSVLAFIN